MYRVWDYFNFAVWFAGLGYLVLWLSGTLDHLALPPGLHLIGVVSALFVPVRATFCMISRRRAAAACMPKIHPRSPHAVLRQVRPKARTLAPLPTVKPRNHFGLRGRPE